MVPGESGERFEGPARPLPTAVLGATGLVGQRLVTLLEAHPWFELIEVAASPESVVLCDAMLDGFMHANTNQGALHISHFGRRATVLELRLRLRPVCPCYVSCHVMCILCACI